MENNYGWREGDIGIVVNGKNSFSVNSIVQLQSGTNLPYALWSLLKGFCNFSVAYNSSPGAYLEYGCVVKMSEYFEDPFNPTQEELDYLCMIHGCKLTLNDLRGLDE